MLLFIGLGLTVTGSLLAALMDAWSSRLMLQYFDAVESNLTKVIAAVRSGSSELEVAGVDSKRDKRLDRARGLKTVGWLLLVLGLTVQLAVAYLARSGTR